MLLSFSILSWDAWAPGLSSREDWLEWFSKSQVLEDKGQVPKIPAIPAGMRRRMSRLSQASLRVAGNCLTGELAGGLHTIFATRSGEIVTTEKILNDIANAEPISPAAFSTSTFNTAAGFYSMLNSSHAPVTSLVSTPNPLETGWIESMSLMASGEKNVLLVISDETLPEIFASRSEEPSVCHAVALLLSSVPRDKGSTYVWNSSRAGGGTKTEPLDLLRWLLNVSGAENFSFSSIGEIKRSVE